MSILQAKRDGTESPVQIELPVSFDVEVPCLKKGVHVGIVDYDLVGAAFDVSRGK